MLELKCQACGRHLGEAEVIVADLLCSNGSCKASTQFKILNADQVKLIKYKFMKPEKLSKIKQAEVS